MPSDLEERPYNLYRAGPRGLRARLRGEEDSLLPREGPPHEDEPGRAVRRRRDGWAIARRALKYLAIAVAAWLLLSLVLFVISAQIETGGLPSSASAALHSGPNMLTGTDT